MTARIHTVPGPRLLIRSRSYDSLYDTFKLKYQFGVDYLAIGRRVDSVQYNYDYSEKDEISALPPIPYIQISGEF
jgi:hypothetical protein